MKLKPLLLSLPLALSLLATPAYALEYRSTPSTGRPRTPSVKPPAWRGTPGRTPMWTKAATPP